MTLPSEPFGLIDPRWVRFDLTEPTGRFHRVRCWWCRRRGHKPLAGVVSGWWSPAAGRIPEQKIQGIGLLCDRCNVWLARPDWPAGVHPALVRDVQLQVGVELDVGPPSAQSSDWPTTRGR